MHTYFYLGGGGSFLCTCYCIGLCLLYRWNAASRSDRKTSPTRRYIFSTLVSAMPPKRSRSAQGSFAGLHRPCQSTSSYRLETRCHDVQIGIFYTWYHTTFARSGGIAHTFCFHLREGAYLPSVLNYKQYCTVHVPYCTVPLKDDARAKRPTVEAD